MIDRYPVRTAGRKMRKRERLGGGPYICPLCGETDPVSLLLVTSEWLDKKGVPTTLFEEHHFLIRAHDSEATVLLCRNCHAKATEGILMAGVTMRPEPNREIRWALKLEALAAHFQLVSTSLLKSAAEIRLGKKQ
jgi:hypothetical protein